MTETEKAQKDQRIEKAAQLARHYELTYFGCSQTTLSGLMEAFCVTNLDLLRASTCFAGGISRRGHVCGALTGGLMMIGYLMGRDDLEMFPQYQRGMEIANRLYEKFRAEYGTVSCREIQKIKFGREFDLQDAEEREALHKEMTECQDGCQSVTSMGARLAAEIIVDMLREGAPLARQLIAY